MEQDIAKSRQIWAILLKLQICVFSDWQSWTYKTIEKLAIEDIPYWVFSLANSNTLEDAIEAVNDDTVDEDSNFLDTDAIILGILYLLYSKKHMNLNVMWHKFSEFVDVHQFVDSGRWKNYSEQDINIEHLTGAELTEAIFRPLSEFAKSMLDKHLEQCLDFT